MTYALLFLVAAIGTFFIRYSGIALLGGGRELPPPVARGLRLVGPAALAAIAADTLLVDDGSIRPFGAWHIAGLVAIVVALWLRSMGWTLLIGGAVFALAIAILGGCSVSPGASSSTPPSPTLSPSLSSPTPLTPSPSTALSHPAPNVDPPPPPGTPFQIRLDGGVPDDPNARIVEVDGQAPEDLVGRLEREGVYTVCYMSAGTLEEYRLDAGEYPDEVVGHSLPDWPDERYVDLRRLDVLGPIWAARLDACAEAGFDAVDPDNIDSYANDSGFPLTEDDAVAAALWLADAAHSRGLGIAQKNAPELTPRLVDALDFAVTEECLTQGWCEEIAAYVDAGKPVLAIEYIEDGATLAALCPAAEAARLSLLVTTLDLPGDGVRCSDA
jgi:branched-subunit amino acid transport protein